MKTYTLSDQEVQIILQALGDVPLRISGPVFTRLKGQFEDAMAKDLQAQIDVQQKPPIDRGSP